MAVTQAHPPFRNRAVGTTPALLPQPGALPPLVGPTGGNPAPPRPDAERAKPVVEMANAEAGLSARLLAPHGAGPSWVPLGP